MIFPKRLSFLFIFCFVSTSYAGGMDKYPDGERASLLRGPVHSPLAVYPSDSQAIVGKSEFKDQYENMTRLLPHRLIQEFQLVEQQMKRGTLDLDSVVVTLLGVAQKGHPIAMELFADNLIKLARRKAGIASMHHQVSALGGTSQVGRDVAVMGALIGSASTSRELAANYASAKRAYATAAPYYSHGSIYYDSLMTRAGRANADSEDASGCCC